MAHWAAILAGGEGSRLRSITSALTGDDRPKQFCSLLSGSTLLEETRARVTASTDAERTAIITTAHHRRFYGADLLATPSDLLIEQPSSCGTAAAVAFALGRLRRLDPHAVVAFFPSDHYYSRPSAVQQATHLALLTANVYRDGLVLIGAAAERAEADYGWIMPGPVASTPFSDRPVFSVEGFREKPSAARAEELLQRGGLWNTFITVGTVQAFASALAATLPAHADFAGAVAQATRDDDERQIVAQAYATLAPACFSSHVLARVADRCLVVKMTGAGWVDVGRPERLLTAKADALAGQSGAMATTTLRQSA